MNSPVRRSGYTGSLAKWRDGSRLKSPNRPPKGAPESLYCLDGPGKRERERERDASAMLMHLVNAPFGDANSEAALDAVKEMTLINLRPFV